MTRNVTSWTIKPVKLENRFTATAGTFDYGVRLTEWFQICSLSVMATCVSSSRYDADVGWFVIGFYAVYVMNLFVNRERPSKNCFCDKAMLVDITILHRAFMFWAKKLNVTVRSSDSTTWNKSGSPFNIIPAKHFKDRVMSYSHNGSNFSRRQTGLIE